MAWQSVQDLNENGLLTAEAVCLIDAQARVIAADAAIDDWLKILDSGLVAEALERLFAGVNDVAVEVGQGLAGFSGPLRVCMRRLEGNAGPLALVTLRTDAAIVVRDALTGLPDRQAIADRIANWCGTSGSSTPRFAVLFLDLNGFKQINDEHGHAAGDRVLEEVARRLIQCVRDDDLVARYGGDEFVLLLKDIATVEDAEHVIERIQHCVRQSVEVGELQLQIHATIGIAIPESMSQPVEELIAAADQDMYARKRRLPK